MGYERLDWDSEFFGVPIGRVTGGGAELGESVRAADADGLRCLYRLCPGDDHEALGAALDLGFRLYDTRVELDAPVGRLAGGSPAAREARPEDGAALEALARERMRDTRFWNDPHFDRERVADLYAAWVRRGLDGAPERRTFLAGEADGFIVCHFDTAAGTGAIELIAVAAGTERRGLGGELVGAASRAFADAGLARATVVTQGTNLGAQRLYQRCGYRTSRFDFWLHRWPEDWAPRRQGAPARAPLEPA